MKKKLITLSNVDDFIIDNKLLVSKEMVLQPTVKDYLKNKGVSLEYCSEKEDILKKAEEILKNDFKIEDSCLIEKIMAKLKGVIKNEY